MNDEKSVSRNVQRSKHMNSHVASYTLTSQHVWNDGKPTEFYKNDLLHNELEWYSCTKYTYIHKRCTHTHTFAANEKLEMRINTEEKKKSKIRHIKKCCTCVSCMCMFLLFFVYFCFLMNICISAGILYDALVRLDKLNE